jgi:adenine-specific DNA-methyltransferase
MPPRKAPAKKVPAQIKSVRHKDKRLNIPTEEQRDFVADSERDPTPVEYERPLLYPRDPDADPQLVWRGKDEEDGSLLTVPALPLYIQEKIDPRALVEDLRRVSERPAEVAQPSMFADFDGLEGFEQVEFYEHAANWSNRLILGDALLVMNSLAEKESLRGRVQCIYIDPPYGIRFGSNWQVSTRKRVVKDGTDASRQPEQVRAFRDTWEHGIHSYLSYLRDRLVVALDLLADTGSIFVQIGDENVHLVRSLLDEVFGPENFAGHISFRTKIPLRTTLVPHIYDHILWYAKSLDHIKFRRLFEPRHVGRDSQFTSLELADGNRRKMTAAERADPRVWPSGARAYRHTDLVSAGRTESCVFEFEMEGRRFFPSGGKSWKTNPSGMERLIQAGRIEAPARTPNYVFFADDFPVSEMDNVWSDTQGATDRSYVVQTSTKVIERCILMSSDPGDLVLDPTCGAGTTAFVAEQWGRRWITIDTSRVALAIARSRLMAAQYPYYLLADSDDGASKLSELTGLRPERQPHACDVRQGFVYRRVPHVTLGSIAQNERLTNKMTRSEMEQLVVASADQELLVDQPYESPRKIRVSGRFTVESLSPHRNLVAESTRTATDSSSFISTILDNLRISGVQNTFKGERLSFDSLDPLPSDGTLQASGTMTDTEGNVWTVAVAIGPEHGTVSPDMVKEAAREALRGAGYDLLVYCGFAYEAYTLETAKEFAPAGEGFATAEKERQMGKLRVLLARVNPDLAMSEELLKKTGTGNLFTVFGEPDISIEKTNGHYTVAVRGVDVYDPTTGQVRSSSTDDIACWFIDTDYDGDQFFVRHAYFTGADKPYEKLQRALNADIDADAWESLYSTTSRPFDAPSTRRIAVKVINHYGDEVIQVYEVNGKQKPRATAATKRAPIARKSIKVAMTVPKTAVAGKAATATKVAPNTAAAMARRRSSKKT